MSFIPASPEASVPAALSDDAVVARVRAGEQALFELLMRRHNLKLYRTLRAYLKDDADIEEVMQQAYVAAYAQLGTFKGDAAFSTWLLRIGINEALMRLRRSGRLRLVGSADDDASVRNVRTEEPGPEDRLASAELGRLTEAAIDELPDHYRAVFVLREVEGLNTREVAAALGLSEPVIKQRLHRAKERIRRGIHARLDRHLQDAFPFRAERCDRVVHAVLSALSLAGCP